jgi:hypothetical protein
MLAGVDPGERLELAAACSDGRPTLDDQGLVVAIPTPTKMSSGDVSYYFDYKATDTYDVDVNGFGGSHFGPDNKLVASDPFDRFAFKNGSDPVEFDVARPTSQLQLAASTFGFLLEYDPCFWAGIRERSLAGVPAVNSQQFSGASDGLLHRGGATFRLWGSPATLQVDPNGVQGILTITLRGRDGGFPVDPSGSTTDLGTISGTLSLNSYGGLNGSVSGPGGTIGTATGYRSGSGIALAMQLRSPGNEVIWGVVALDRK